MLSKLLLIMGVSGSGKSSIASAIAAHSSMLYLDADDFHSDQAKQLMAQGVAIDDQIRHAWITRMLEHLSTNTLNGKVVVLAYSGLKAFQRERFSQSANTVYRFYLHGSPAILSERLAKRNSHFFSAELLTDQLANFELPQELDDRTEQIIDINLSLNQQVKLIEDFIK